MTNKTSTAKPNANQIAPVKKSEQTDNERYAKISLTASTMSAVLTDAFTKKLFPNSEIVDVASVLSEKITDIQNGDMKPIEAMLIAQAQALQTMFVSLGREAVGKTQLNQYTAFMNLALKAQSQSRATIQALIELKYPKQATFVKQANIANGHQQVNNGTNTHAHAKEKDNQPNELLEVNNGSTTMDTRATQTTIPQDKTMATVAAQHRS